MQAHCTQLFAEGSGTTRKYQVVYAVLVTCWKSKEFQTRTHRTSSSRPLAKLKALLNKCGAANVVLLGLSLVSASARVVLTGVVYRQTRYS